MERIETNSQFAQIIAPSDMIAIVTLNMKIGEVEGFMNVCLPFFTLESVMDKLNTKYWYANLQEQGDEDFEEYIEALIKRVDVPVKAVLGKTSISVTDFVNLQVGDDVERDHQYDGKYIYGFFFTGVIRGILFLGNGLRPIPYEPEGVGGVLPDRRSSDVSDLFFL